MGLKFWLVNFLCWSFLWSAVYANASHWLKTKYKVTKVLAGDKFSVNFNGMALVVKLVSVEVSDEEKAKALLKKTIEGEKVTIIPDEEAGVSPEGLQLVYNVVAKSGKKVFLNEKLIEDGLATYVPVKSKLYKSLQSKLKTAASKQKKVSSTSSVSKKAVVLDANSKVCSELYSRKYHLLNCRWGKMISKQSRIIYEGFDAAEKAKKMPCSHCLYERVKEVRRKKAVSNKAKSQSARKAPVASSSKPVGGLIGIVGDKSFYSPVSKKLANLPKDKFVIFKTLKEARASGRRPDPGSLRIDNPIVPGPEKGECIGRGLPYLRPCRRDAGHQTGLCEPCLNGRVR